MEKKHRILRINFCLYNRESKTNVYTIIGTMIFVLLSLLYRQKLILKILCFFSIFYDYSYNTIIIIVIYLQDKI